MRFSIPTETGLGKGGIERRAALSPAGVHELCLTGAEVFVQQHAGRGAGFTDEAYRAAGAHLVYTAAEAYGRADVVLRVERPREEDWTLLPDGSTLIAFLHLHTASTSMKRGAVILDFAINEGGCVATSRLTPTEDGVFVQDGIV